MYCWVTTVHSVMFLGCWLGNSQFSKLKELLKHKQCKSSRENSSIDGLQAGLVSIMVSKAHQIEKRLEMTAFHKISKWMFKIQKSLEMTVFHQI